MKDARVKPGGGRQRQEMPTLAAAFGGICGCHHQGRDAPKHCVGTIWPQMSEVLEVEKFWYKKSQAFLNYCYNAKLAATLYYNLIVKYHQ